NDNETVQLGNRTLRFLHTRGHANHHFCVLDEREGDIFTGDAFGLIYPLLQRAGLFAFPSTSPTDFDPEEARRSVRRIAGSGMARAYPTHFGEVTRISETAEQVLAWLDESEAILESAIAGSLPDSALEKYCAERLNAAFDSAFARRGLSPTRE